MTPLARKSRTLSAASGAFARDRLGGLLRRVSSFSRPHTEKRSRADAQTLPSLKHAPYPSIHTHTSRPSFLPSFLLNTSPTLPPSALYRPSRQTSKRCGLPVGRLVLPSSNSTTRETPRMQSARWMEPEFVEYVLASSSLTTAEVEAAEDVEVDTEAAEEEVETEETDPDRAPARPDGPDPDHLVVRARLRPNTMTARDLPAETDPSLEADLALLLATNSDLCNKKPHLTLSPTYSL
ncbi:hypothetical protein PFISCL1PPCAC_8335 [Pristionchus fissidentatus]|uniref:Uncharacterized protein n=1 Tax=Pristionchus fissidentatus TaxID=1538716 RepID=A0AAV5VFL4_9BILA|nr:hypothetical protein PFISCL1PPCAC_8335 [Pristionchus fissidentatus]